MYSLRILSSAQTNDLLNMGDAISDVELAYKLYAREEAGVFPVIVHHFESGKREMDLKSGHLAGAGVFGMKMLGFCSENPQRGLAPLAGLIVVMDVDKQQPIGILDGTPITFMRTGAAGAVAARALARKDSKKVLIAGAGNQGRAQLLGLATAMPALEEIYICDILYENSCRFVNEQNGKFPNLQLKAVLYAELAEIAGQADIIVTCTRSREFYIHKEWIKAGTHINAIGADMPGKQEIEPELMANVRLFGDSRAQVIQKGECQHAAKSGRVSADDITEIGEVLEGMKPGRRSEDDITLFDATGMAIQDLIVSAQLLEKAKELNIGLEVEF